MKGLAVAFILGVLVASGAAVVAQDVVAVPVLLMQSDGTILDTIRAKMSPDGSLGPWERWHYLGIEGGSEVHAVAEEGYFHVVSCGKPAIPEPEYREVFLPFAYRRVR